MFSFIAWQWRFHSLAKVRPFRLKCSQCHVVFVQNILQNCMLAFIWSSPIHRPCNINIQGSLISLFFMQFSARILSNNRLMPSSVGKILNPPLISARSFGYKLQDINGGMHMWIRWSLLGSYICFITMSLDTVDMHKFIAETMHNLSDTKLLLLVGS